MAILTPLTWEYIPPSSNDRLVKKTLTKFGNRFISDLKTSQASGVSAFFSHHPTFFIPATPFSEI